MSKCMSAYVPVCVYVYIYICKYVFMRIKMHLCTSKHVYMYMCTYVPTLMCINAVDIRRYGNTCMYEVYVYVYFFVSI